MVDRRTIKNDKHEESTAANNISQPNSSSPDSVERNEHGSGQCPLSKPSASHHARFSSHSSRSPINNMSASQSSKDIDGSAQKSLHSHDSKYASTHKKQGENGTDALNSKLSHLKHFLTEQDRNESNAQLSTNSPRTRAYSEASYPHTPQKKSRSSPRPRRKSRTSSFSSSHKPTIANDDNISRKSVDRQSDTNISVLSEATEDDVWMPTTSKQDKRINGIDFFELQKYVNDYKINLEKIRKLNHYSPLNSRYSISNSSTASTQLSPIMSAAAMKYTPKYAHSLNFKAATPSAQQQKNANHADATKKDDAAGVSFGPNKIETSSSEELNAGPSPVYQPPIRFSFFSTREEETIHSPEIASLLKDDRTFCDLFHQGKPTWWLNCICPTDEEMKILTSAFGIHALTTEDIKMQEPREKVEIFKTYYFISFHTLDIDKESENYLERINMYFIVFRNGILSFHYSPVDHCGNVRKRIRQLRNYVEVNADWICYALIDDITDHFAPVIHSIEYSADAFEDTVFLNRDSDFSTTLQRIGKNRRKVMALMRLLSGKADVIKMLAKRFHDYQKRQKSLLSTNNNSGNTTKPDESNNNSKDISTSEGSSTTITNNNNNNNHFLNTLHPIDDDSCIMLSYLPGGDIAMYLGDIQDHILTMQNNLRSYENIFARTHANYLAQLQVESFNSNNRVSEILGKVTILGTMLIPLNVITGLFGMNVKVPGRDVGNLAWFFGIFGVLFAIGIGGWIFANVWITRINKPILTTTNNPRKSNYFWKYLPASWRPHPDKNNDDDDEVSSTISTRSTSVYSKQSKSSMASRYSRYQ
ncbi:magnesium transporter CorA family protein NDAI_0A06250 [Naumovozyma dairenensis CBS 421]|uniref:Uncharacterized protein n=1 Tax=Naumovozyma dairenensis (strain ATCC 10597 / BCRC 20456 / CBS 421 / NBRC 0211 / NRRL Y-12639) TaxID=1071378 RepID=G0W4P1_NAUDC|nr:hypothetical protein NDAI_0A06250 [Naumovozyma dairenensis CBS 421]CCD22779.1 hypothetical protein NDAI_0A06250 [Naumovozyma dairenensis CBS 421]